MTRHAKALTLLAASLVCVTGVGIDAAGPPRLAGYSPVPIAGLDAQQVLVTGVRLQAGLTLSSGTASTILPTSFIWTSTFPTPGTFFLTVVNPDGKRSNVLSVTVLAQPPPPPPPIVDGIGPQFTIVCPAGAVDIAPGADIQGMVTLYQPSTTFCLKAGTHNLTGSITPKSGDTFIGEYGAVLDGRGWSTSDGTQAAFRAHNENIDNVTIRNLVIQRMPQQGIHATSLVPAPTADGWTVDHCDFDYNVTGIQAGNGFMISNNHFRYNIGSPGAPPAINGGAWNLFKANDVTFLNNEAAFNASETKIGDSQRITFRNNYIHHQAYNGLWFDEDADGSIVEDNVFEDIPIYSIFIEISRNVIVRNNTILRSGWAGIAMHTSKDVEVSGNTVDTPTGGLFGILNRVECSRISATLDYDATRNTIHDNMVSGDYFYASTGFIIGQSLATCSFDYLNNVKQNNWVHNSYNVTNPAASVFVWGIDPVSAFGFGAWQGLNQDRTGAIF